MVTKCENCGENMNPERAELGYTYCMKDDCLKNCQPRISGVAVVMVHKQGFNVMRTEDVVGQNFMDVHGRAD